MAALAASASLTTSLARASVREFQGLKPFTNSAKLQRLGMLPKSMNGKGALGDRCYIGSPTNLRVARLMVEAKQSEMEPLTFEESIKDAWTALTKSNAVRNAAVVAMNVVLTMPALAEEKGKIFDFNLTLPIIAIEFLTLMVALDNIWFKPVAAVMDQRDVDIREKLLGVRDNSGEIKKLQDEAEALIKAARAETTASLNQTKKETAAALEKNLQESKARIEKELAASLANLEEQKEETMKGLDKQVQALSDEIISKVLPFAV